MSPKHLIRVILVEKGTTYRDMLTEIGQPRELQITKKESVSDVEDCLTGVDSVLLVVDVLGKKIFEESLQLLKNSANENISCLFLLGETPSYLDALKTGEYSNIDLLPKPVCKNWFFCKIRNLLCFIELKNRLKKEIRERESVLSSLLDEKRYAESLINSSMDMIISVDLDRKILEFNSSAQKVFGYTKEEVIGKPVDILYADLDQSLKVYSNTLKKHQYSAEILNKRKNGEIFPSIISASVIVEREGKILGLMGISRDVSDWKRVETELRRTKEQAETASRAKSEFLANMSHEIRTPMTSVIGYAELLEDRIKDQPEHLEFVKIIRRNGEHLLRLMNDILDLSLVERGKLIVKPVYCKPRTIIKNLRHILKSNSDEKQQEFNLIYEGDLPETVYSDPTRILQCLVNLVGNAIKFTPQGGKVYMHVNYVSKSFGAFLDFRVKDSGIGIPKEKLELIMQPFEQGDLPTQMESTGTGLGLSITRSLAELLGGHLRVESAENEGSTFTLRINCGLKGPEIHLTDLEFERESEMNTRLSSMFDNSNADPNLNGRILLVEDNLDIQKLIEYFLVKSGAQVDTAVNGSQALCQALNKAYDLIFMDMGLPGMDGVAVVKNLREKGYDKPIVALTASGMRKSLQRFMESGCNDYAVKPISRWKVIALARRWLNSSLSDSGLTATIKESSEYAIESLKEMTEIGVLKTSKEHPLPLNSEEFSLIFSSYHDDPEMEDIVYEYVSTLPNKLIKMNEALESNDLQSMIRIAHGLHGSGGGFGFQVLSDLGGKLERMIEKKAEKREIKKSLEDLSKVIERIMPAYEAENG